jgi:hypothetical protein
MALVHGMHEGEELLLFVCVSPEARSRRRRKGLRSAGAATRNSRESLRLGTHKESTKRSKANISLTH